MDRRSLLINISIALGCAVTPFYAKAVESALTYKNRQPKLTASMVMALQVIADIILPKTDTPSASDAGVHLYIDYFLHDFYSKKQRHEFIQALESEIESADQFLAKTHIAQTQLIQDMDDRLGSENEASIYRELRNLIIIAYFSSEVGAKQALSYDPVPGGYKEIKLKDVGRAWY